MLLYKNGRFHGLGLSFELPEGFYLETEPDLCCELGLGAWTPDMRFYVDWQIDDQRQGTREELEGLFSPDSGVMVHGSLEPIEVNGLAGHQAAYRGNDREHWEFRLSPGDDRQVAVVIYAAEPDTPCDDIQDLAARILQGIRYEGDPEDEA